jgi:hypothetical protein
MVWNTNLRVTGSIERFLDQVDFFLCWYLFPFLSSVKLPMLDLTRQAYIDGHFSYLTSPNYYQFLTKTLQFFEQMTRCRTERPSGHRMSLKIQCTLSELWSILYPPGWFSCAGMESLRDSGALEENLTRLLRRSPEEQAPKLVHLAGRTWISIHTFTESRLAPKKSDIASAVNLAL